MTSAPPVGITPPTPGLEHEEPEFALEEDIPVEDETARRDPRPDAGGRAASGDGLRDGERE